MGALPSSSNHHVGEGTEAQYTEAAKGSRGTGSRSSVLGPFYLSGSPLLSLSPPLSLSQSLPPHNRDLEVQAEKRHSGPDRPSGLAMQGWRQVVSPSGSEELRQTLPSCDSSYLGSFTEPSRVHCPERKALLLVAWEISILITIKSQVAV